MRISALPFLTEEARRQLNVKQERIQPHQAFEPFPRLINDVLIPPRPLAYSVYRNMDTMRHLYFLLAGIPGDASSIKALTAWGNAVAGHRQ